MSLKNFSQLHQLNQQLKPLLDELLAILEQEHQHLVAQATEDLLATTAVKQQLTEQINDVDQQRGQLLQQLGVQNNKHELDELAATAGQQIDGFAENWQQIELLITQCADKNQVNGIILGNNRRNVETRLSILRGQPTTTDSYTNTGKKSSDPDSRSLAHV
jgi:flagellar biosynthesis/type III secretory pathway chaperone